MYGSPSIDSVGSSCEKAFPNAAFGYCETRGTGMLPPGAPKPLVTRVVAASKPSGFPSVNWGGRAPKPASTPSLVVSRDVWTPAPNSCIGSQLPIKREKLKNPIVAQRIDLVGFIRKNGMKAAVLRWLILDMCASGQVCIEWLVKNGCPLENIKAQVPVTGSGLSLDKVYPRDTLIKMFGKAYILGAYA